MKRGTWAVKALPWGLLAVLLLPACGSDEGPPGTPPEAPYTRESMIQACVRMHSCGVFQLTHVHNCITDYESRVVVPAGKAKLYEKLHRCVNQAKGDCTKVRSCFGNQPTDPQCDMSYTPGCEGSVRRFCDTLDKRIYRVDCAQGGLTCALDDQGQPFCAAGSCASKTQNECRDNNTKRVYCVGQGLMVEQCDWIGLACGLDRDQNIGCVATGKECKG